MSALQSKHSGELAGHLGQIVSVSVFSVGIMVQKDLAARYAAADIVLVQFAISAILMWIACWALGYLPRRWSDALPGILWGMLTPGLVFLFATEGAVRTDGVSVALIWGLIPLLSPIAGRIVLGERFHWSLPLGATIGFCGVLGLTLNRQSIGAGDALGNLLVVAGVMAVVLGQLIGRRLNTRGAPWFRMATLQITGAMLISLFYVGLDGNWAPTIVAYDWHTIVSMAYLVFGMTIVNFIGYNLALSRIQIAWISLYSSLSPAIGTMTAVILLAALVRPSDVFGIALIIGGVALPHLFRLLNARRAAVK
jgi:drug/metabolite transporter (DMT)-like permease